MKKEKTREWKYWMTLENCGQLKLFQNYFDAQDFSDMHHLDAEILPIKMVEIRLSESKKEILKQRRMKAKKEWLESYSVKKVKRKKRIKKVRKKRLLNRRKK